MTTPAAAKVPHIERQPRRADGRVVSTYSNGQLYRIVKEVALALNPENPETLSVRQFDRTVASLGYADAPSARAICGRLKRGWREIVELALSPKPSVKKIDVPQMSDEAKWLTERHVFFALNAMARFKNVETMTAHDYDHYLAEFLAVRRQPTHILGRNARFPTSSQIERLAQNFESKQETKAWEKALLYAGLQPVKTVTANALTVVEAINLYIEASGCEFYPSSKELPRLREEFGISIREREGGRRWAELIKEALDGRAAAGLPVPTELAGISTKAKLVLPPGYIGAAQLRTPKGTWADQSDEELAEAITPYVLDCLNRTPPVRPTKKNYQQWCSGRSECPSGNTLGARKTWGAWVTLVEERLLEAKKAA